MCITMWSTMSLEEGVTVRPLVEVMNAGKTIATC